MHFSDFKTNKNSLKHFHKFCLEISPSYFISKACFLGVAVIHISTFNLSNHSNSGQSGQLSSVQSQNHYFELEPVAKFQTLNDKCTGFSCVFI